MKNNMYIDNEELERELNAWRDSASDVEQRMPSERLGELLILMHDNVLKHRNFRGYRADLKEEMKSFSLFRIFKCGLKSFKFGKAKAFSYFTRAIFLNYITIIQKYYARLNKHQKYVKGQLASMNTHGDPQLESLIEHFCQSGDVDEFYSNKI